MAGYLMPGGASHASRSMLPHPVHFVAAEGARKIDADGNAYIDYGIGQGALLLGHGDRTIEHACARALRNSALLASNHAGETEWAARVQRLVPSAERIRFTASGNEAVQLALRLARAATGRRRIVKLAGHYHGWSDPLAADEGVGDAGARRLGLSTAATQDVIVLPARRAAAALEQCLQQTSDIAALILEPTGAAFGRIPLSADELTQLREITRTHHIVLIFDEVITGFRVSTGGAQGASGVLPDLTVLGKILGGGMPAGAVAGGVAIMALLEPGDEGQPPRIIHQGTANGHGLSAAAGCAMLDAVATRDAPRQAETVAQRLREKLNEAIADAGVPWAAYGESSGFHLFTNPRARAIDPARFSPDAVEDDELLRSKPGLVRMLRIALLNHGIDINPWPGGLLSCAHGDDDVEATAGGLARALRDLKDEGWT